MSTEILRRAASLMRERATSAAGEFNDWYAEHEIHYALTQSGSTTDLDADTAHIASWHPAVALAVADWLDMTAGQVANYGPNMDSPWTKPHEQMARAVARAYLGDGAL